MKRTIILTAAAIALSACAGTPPQLLDTMNEADLKRLQGAQHYAYHGTLSNQSAWSNIKTGMGGTVRALDQYLDPDSGLLCRKMLEHTRSVDGVEEHRVGTACQQPDGSLRVIYTDRAATKGED